MKITKINGIYYDLSTFDHPGGKTAILHSFDRDATILFKSHHPFVSENKLETTLKKYEITDLPEGYTLFEGEKDIPQFNYDTEFFKELKHEVRKYFETESKQRGIKLLEATKATPWRWFQLFVLTIFKIFSNIIWIQGWWISLILFPLFDWICSVNIFHDASHFAMSINPTVNLWLAYIHGISLTSPQYWFHQHNIAHHTYSNIPHKDPD